MEQAYSPTELAFLGSGGILVIGDTDLLATPAFEIKNVTIDGNTISCHMAHPGWYDNTDVGIGGGIASINCRFVNIKNNNVFGIRDWLNTHVDILKWNGWSTIESVSGISVHYFGTLKPVYGSCCFNSIAIPTVYSSITACGIQLIDIGSFQVFQNMVVGNSIGGDSKSCYRLDANPSDVGLGDFTVGTGSRYIEANTDYSSTGVLGLAGVFDPATPTTLNKVNINTIFAAHINDTYLII